MHTLLAITKNAAGSTLIDERPEFADASRAVVEDAARRLSAEDLDGIRYQVVMALAGVTKHTTPADLTIADLRFLASEVADLDFFSQAPEWAIEAIDSMATRRNFSEKSVKHVLAAIRCIKGVNARLARQVEKDEAKVATRRG